MRSPHDYSGISRSSYCLRQGETSWLEIFPKQTNPRVVSTTIPDVERFGLVHSGHTRRKVVEETASHLLPLLLSPPLKVSADTRNIGFTQRFTLNNRGLDLAKLRTPGKKETRALEITGF